MPHAWIGRIKIVKMKCTIHSKSTDLIQSLLNYQQYFPDQNLKKKIPKNLCTETHKTQKPKQSCKEKWSKSGREDRGARLQTHYRAAGSKGSIFWHKNRNKHEWDNTKPRDKLPIIQAMSNKGDKTLSIEELIFNKQCRETRTRLHTKKKNQIILLKNKKQTD